MCLTFWPINWITYLGMHLPLTSTLFPYTTLFRSRHYRLEARKQTGAAPLRSRDRDSARARRHGHSDCLDPARRSEEHTSELQSHSELVCRLLLEKKNFQFSASAGNIQNSK